MSEETCGGRVVKFWQVGNARYFLRDDRDAGLCCHERYSLFRGSHGYGRVIILSMPLEEAEKQAWMEIDAEQAEKELKKRTEKIKLDRTEVYYERAMKRSAEIKERAKREA